MAKEIKNHVQHIVNTIEDGLDSQENEGFGMDGLEYLQDALDIQYIVNSNKEVLGARILVAFGGPNIWINTFTHEVEGYWWGDTCKLPYIKDSIGLDEAIETIWNC